MTRREVFGIEELRRQFKEEEKASGRSPEQSKAKQLMDMHLNSAARGEAWKPFPPPMIESGVWLGPHRGHMWDIWQEAERARSWLKQQKGRRAALQNWFALMYFGLAYLMESAALYDRVRRTTPREKGPSADELCSSCRDRIERRYLPPLDSTQKARTIRLYFKVNQRRMRRAQETCVAWQIAREHRLFPSRNKFAEYAHEIVHVAPRWILRWISRPVVASKDRPA